MKRKALSKFFKDRTNTEKRIFTSKSYFGAIVTISRQTNDDVVLEIRQPEKNTQTFILG